MTILFEVEILTPKQNCHPDRSEAQWRDLLFYHFREFSRGLLTARLSPALIQNGVYGRN
jgi:hypothetical protein